jgi:hypothetical protein
MQCPTCRRAALTLALLAGALLASALPAGSALAANGSSGSGATTIYRWVDAQGVVHYTDSPQPGAQQLQVQPAQTYRAPAAQDVPSADAAGPPGSTYEACLIAQPTAQQSFYAPDQVIVNVEIVPALQSGDQLSVTVDGTPLPPADDSGTDFAITAPYRGAHTLAAVVHDASGRTLCRAPPVTFYVQRPSLLSPQSPARAGLAPAAPGGVATIPHGNAPPPPAAPPLPH